MNQAAKLRSRRAWTSVVLGVLTVLAFAGPVHAQGDDGLANEAFLASVAEMRDESWGRIEAVQQAIGVACQGLASEACLTTHEADGMATMAAELDAYATQLEGLDVPDEFSDDAETQVAWLRDTAGSIDESIALARAFDVLAFDAAIFLRIDATETLASQLDPEWARAAFLSEFGPGLNPAVDDLVADERAYLAAARTAGEAAASNFDCFGRATQTTYQTTNGLLQALSDCGAGTALPAIEAATAAIEPPERFADDHAWLLAGRAELSRLDRLIGEAAAEGDVVKFLVNNARTGLALRLPPDLGPGVAGLMGPNRVLDPSGPLAQTGYGQALFIALRDYSSVDPFAATLAALGFPSVPRSEALPAVVELKPELQALNEEFKAAVEALEPPPELAADHAIIIDFFETYTQRLDDMFEAAEAGDAAATFAVETAMDGAFCEASSALSEAVLEVAFAYFGPPFTLICA